MTTTPTSRQHTLERCHPERSEAQSKDLRFAPCQLPQTHLIAAAQPETTGPISHPAPPLPLTEQERLLIRFVRHNNPNDLAEISDERKAARAEQEAAEFTAFFTPPPLPPINGESE